MQLVPVIVLKFSIGELYRAIQKSFYQVGHDIKNSAFNRILSNNNCLIEIFVVITKVKSL
jgi:hypothetical protein